MFSKLALLSFSACPIRYLTAVKDILCSLLLGAVHAQAVVVLHLHIGTNVFALVSLSWWKPLCHVLITLGLVDIVGDGEKLWASDTKKSVNNQHTGDKMQGLLTHLRTPHAGWQSSPWHQKPKPPSMGRCDQCRRRRRQSMFHRRSQSTRYQTSPCRHCS